MLVTEEALAPSAEELRACLAGQAAWSDLPVLLLTDAARPSLAGELRGLLASANVTLLQRPLGALTLLSALASALRARRRQYQLRRLIEDLERAVRFGEMLVGVLGHDLRSPLSSARVSAELILRASHDERALRAARRVIAATDRMRRLIDDLLDYTQVRRGLGMPIRRRRADLGAICRAAATEVESAGLSARIELQQRGDLQGLWDPDRLAQLAANLITNAVRHGAGSSPVTVDLDGGERTFVRLSVHNAGAVEPALMPVLFEAFAGLDGAQPNAEQRASRRGLGLGLYISREITRAHGGEIGVVSREAEGTTFTVTLPRRGKAG